MLYEKEVREDLETYKRVLSGELKCFPRGFCDKVYSKESSAIILRYLIEDTLKLSRKELLSVYNNKFIEKNRIRILAKKLFKNSIFKLLDNAYPGEFREWELNKVDNGFWTDANVIRAIKWFVEDVHSLNGYKDRDEIIKIFNAKNLASYGLDYIGHSGLYKSINKVYPNVYSADDFKSINRMTDRTGEIYNNLQIVKELGRRRVKAKCLLCGSEKEYNKSTILDGLTKNCGCKHGSIIDRTGEVFNNLQIVKELGGKKVLARCLLCRSEKEYYKGNIVCGRVKNCDCVKDIKKGYKTYKIEVLDFMYKGRDKLWYYRCLNSKGEEIILSREDIVKLG